MFDHSCLFCKIQYLTQLGPSIVCLLSTVTIPESPSFKPSASPSTKPSGTPTGKPSITPSQSPTGEGESAPSETPSSSPISIPIDNCPEKAFDICIAIDYSGSVCTKSGESPQNCYPSDTNSKCDMSLGFPDRCPNFQLVKSFVADLISEVEGVGPNKQFSLVTFSDVSKTTTIAELTSADSALNQVSDIAYLGGWTNTGGAINACADTLADSDKEKVIVLVTDGTPTTGASNPLGYAQLEAQNAMEAGILMLPMYINTVSKDLINMQSFTNDPANVVEVKAFEELPDALDELLNKIDCDEPVKEPGNVVDPCSNIYDDFSDGFNGWSTGGDASRYTGSRVVDDYNVQGSLRMQGGSSTTFIKKSFDAEIQKMTVETEVTVKFDACYESVESYHSDDLYLMYNAGNGWSTVKVWKSDDLSYGSNSGCHLGEEVSFNVPAATSALEIGFQFTGGYYNDVYYITEIDIDICEGKLWRSV